MVVLKTSRELKAMRDAGRISSRALKLAGEAVEPGVSTFFSKLWGIPGKRLYFSE